MGNPKSNSMYTISEGLKNPRNVKDKTQKSPDNLVDVLREIQNNLYLYNQLQARKRNIDQIRENFEQQKKENAEYEEYSDKRLALLERRRKILNRDDKRSSKKTSPLDKVRREKEAIWETLQQNKQKLEKKKAELDKAYKNENELNPSINASSAYSLVNKAERLKANLKQSLGDNYPDVSENHQQQIVDNLFEKLINSIDNDDLKNACKSMGRTALEIIAHKSLESLANNVGWEELNKDNAKLSSQAIDGAVDTGFRSASIIAAIYQSTSKEEKASLTSQLVASSGVPETYESKLVQMAELSEGVDYGAHGAEKALEGSHSHAFHHIAHSLSKAGPYLAGLAWVMQGLTLFRKRFVNKEPLTRGDVANMVFSSVFTALTLGAMLTPAGPLVAAGLTVGAYACAGVCGLYNYYREKWEYRKEIDEKFNLYKGKLEKLDNELDNLKENLNTELNKSEDAKNLQKIKRLGNKIQAKQVELQNNFGEYKAIKQAHDEIQKERKQWYKPIRPLRQSLAFFTALGGFIMSFSPLAPVGLGMLAGGLIWGSSDNEIIGDNIIKGTKAFVKDPIGSTAKAVTTISNGLVNFAKDPVNKLNQAKDAVLRVFVPYKQQEAIERRKQEAQAQQNTTQPSRQSQTKLEQTQSVSEQAHYQKQQTSSANPEQPSKTATGKPSLWQRFKNTVKNFFWEQPDQNESSTAATQQQEEKTSSHDEPNKLYESTTELMQQLYGDQAQQIIKTDIETREKERRLDDKLAYMVKNNDYAGVLNFVKKAGSGGSNQTNQAHQDNQKVEQKAEELKTYFNRFKNANEAIKKLDDIVDPQKSTQVDNDDLYDSISENTLEAIKNDPVLKKAVASIIAEAKQGPSYQNERDLEDKITTFLDGHSHDNDTDKQTSYNATNRHQEVDNNNNQPNYSERRSPTTSDPASPDSEDEGENFFPKT